MTLLYDAGDKVVHPAHGAGVVRRVVRRTIAGEPRQYYLIEPLAYDDLEVLVSVEQVGRIGLRDASKRSKMRKALRRLQGSPDEISSDYKERQRRIGEKLQSADPCQVAEVARDLTGLKRDKGGRLGTADTRLLKQARESIAGELAIVEDLTFEEALSRVDEALMLDDGVKTEH
jgi:CarD family transcriptional regulator